MPSHWKSVIAVGVATIALIGAPLHAQTQCAPREKVVERLSEKYGEALAGGGLQSATQVLEIWAAPETGTWTVLLTRADGIACIMASGTDWHQQDPAVVLMGVPS